MGLIPLEAAIPAELVAPSVSNDELTYHPIPLAQGELDPLEQAWIGIVRDKTEQISERQISVLKDPTLGDAATYRALAFMSWLTRSDVRLAIAMDVGVVIQAFVAHLFISRSAGGQRSKSIIARWLISELVLKWRVG